MKLSKAEIDTHLRSCLMNKNSEYFPSILFMSPSAGNLGGDFTPARGLLTDGSLTTCYNIYIYFKNIKINNDTNSPFFSWRSSDLLSNQTNCIIYSIPAVLPCCGCCVQPFYYIYDFKNIRV